MKGWLYVITNEAMPNLVKIGSTEKDPALKVKELNNAEAPHPYIVSYEILVDEPFQVVQDLYSSMKILNKSKEWFSCNVGDAIKKIEESIAKCNKKAYISNIKHGQVENKSAIDNHAIKMTDEELRKKRDSIKRWYDVKLKAAKSPNNLFDHVTSGAFLFGSVGEEKREIIKERDAKLKAVDDKLNE